MDSDNDSPDYKEQFIESGIFEEEEMDLKMEVEKELEMKRMVNKTKAQTLCEAGTQTLEVWIFPFLMFCLIIIIVFLAIIIMSLLLIFILLILTMVRWTSRSRS